MHSFVFASILHSTMLLLSTNLSIKSENRLYNSLLVAQISNTHIMIHKVAISMLWLCVVGIKCKRCIACVHLTDMALFCYILQFRTWAYVGGPQNHKQPQQQRNNITLYMKYPKQASNKPSYIVTYMPI